LFLFAADALLIDSLDRMGARASILSNEISYSCVNTLQRSKGTLASAYEMVATVLKHNCILSNHKKIIFDMALKELGLLKCAFETTSLKRKRSSAAAFDQTDYRIRDISIADAALKVLKLFPDQDNAQSLCSLVEILVHLFTTGLQNEHEFLDVIASMMESLERLIFTTSESYCLQSILPVAVKVYAMGQFHPNSKVCLNLHRLMRALPGSCLDFI
jgi:hypothetical protein